MITLETTVDSMPLTNDVGRTNGTFPRGYERSRRRSNVTFPRGRERFRRRSRNPQRGKEMNFFLIFVSK